MSSAPAATTPLTIAVVKPCCIGDCVMALPAIDSLAKAFPYAHIHAFTGRHSAQVFKSSPNISRVYLTPDQLTASRVPGMAWNLRTAGHDWIVVLDRSRLVKTAARSATPDRLVTIPRQGNDPVHEIDVYLGAVARAGVKAATTIPHIEISDEARYTAGIALESVPRPFAVMHPGGAENPGMAMLDKRWPVARYAEVANRLAERGVHTVLTGGPGDVTTCEQVVRLSKAPVTSLAGTLDLMASAAVAEQSTLYLGADTGMSHIAAAVSTPAVVVFGPTNPERYGPRGEQVEILAPERSRTLPDVDLRKVSSGHDRPSTTEVSVEDVLAAIDRILTTNV